MAYKCYKGLNLIDNIYVGSAEIKSVYKGSSLIWENNPYSSVTTYSVTTSRNNFSINKTISPTIPKGKKFVVNLVSATNRQYVLSVGISSLKTLTNIYSVATNTNKYGVVFTAPDNYTVVNITNYNTPNNTVTVKFTISIYK